MSVGSEKLITIFEVIVEGEVEHREISSKTRASKSSEKPASVKMPPGNLFDIPVGKLSLSKTKTVVSLPEYNKVGKCDKCSGKGFNHKTCGKCDGKGRVKQYREETEKKPCCRSNVCTLCFGAGYYEHKTKVYDGEEQCSKCDGKRGWDIDCSPCAATGMQTKEHFLNVWLTNSEKNLGTIDNLPAGIAVPDTFKKIFPIAKIDYSFESYHSAMRLPAEMNAKRLNEILSKHLESQKSSNNQSFSISRIKFSRVSISVSLKKEGEHSYFETHYFDEKAQRHIFSSGMVSLEGRKEHAKTREFLAKIISQKALEQDLSQLNSTHFIREHATIKDTFEQIGIKYFGGKRPLIETLLPRTRTSTKDNGSFDAILYLLSAVVGFFVAAQGLQAYLQRRLGLNEGQVLVSLLSDTVRATPLTLLSHGIGAGLILAFAYRALHKPFWHFLAGVPLGLVTSLCIWTLPSMLAINERLSGSGLNLSGGSIEPRVVSPTNLYLYFAISLVISLTLNELMRWRPIKWKNQGKLLIFSFHGMTSDKSSEKPWLALIENLRLGWESMLQEAFNRDHQFFASVEPRTSVSESTQTQSQSQSQSSFQKSDTPKPKAPKAEPVSSNVYKIHDEKLVVDTSKSDSPKMAKGSKWSIEQKILLREIGFDENLDRDEVFTKLVTAIADHQKYSREDLKRFGEALDKLGEYKSA